jgi:large subunit ribosomal protein L25
MTNKESIEINAKPRTIGKHTSRELRRTQQIPAVIYGPKISNINCSISEIEAVKYGKIRFENTIFTLKSNAKELSGLKVLRKSMTVHPVSRRPIHIDYYAVDMSAVVRVNVPVKFTGKPEGLGSGGLVQEIMHEIEVECLPANIPGEISLDISKLKMGDVLHASDVQLPENVKLITAPHITLVTITQIKAEEEKPVVAAAAATEAAPAGGAAAAPAADSKKKG